MHRFLVKLVLKLGLTSPRVHAASPHGKPKCQRPWQRAGSTASTEALATASLPFKKIRLARSGNGSGESQRLWGAQDYGATCAKAQ